MSKKVTVEELQNKTANVLQKIIEKRQELGISQTDLALKLNMTTSGYFKIETGKTKLDTYRMFQLFEELNVCPKEFFLDFE
jgi:transcriptional regulator with XRE-family HTH domain